jgi:predicted CoA-binding protein
MSGLYRVDEMTDEAIIELLENVHTVAVVGLSPKPDRPSHRVAKYLQEFSYTIVPVRPGVETILGRQAYKSC